MDRQSTLNLFKSIAGKYAGTDRGLGGSNTMAQFKSLTRSEALRRWHTEELIAADRFASENTNRSDDCPSGFVLMSGVEEGGGEPSSGSTPDKKSSDTYKAPEPSSAHLAPPDRLGQGSVDARIVPRSTFFSSHVLQIFFKSRSLL